MFSKLLSTVLILLVLTVVITAEVPHLLNYQGYLTDNSGSPVADGPYLVKFIIYDAPTGGTELWNAGFQTVNTTDGLFTYELGSNVPLPADLFSDTNRYLGITVGTDAELVPRSRFLASSYAFKSRVADLALDADSLGGLQPSYYRDWNNLTNVPAGFADGIDDNTNTTYNAGNGLSLAGTTFSLAPTITSSHTFNGGDIVFGDSTMRINNLGIRIGDNSGTLQSNLLRINREYNTTASRYGIYNTILNNNTGFIIGAYNRSINGGISSSYGAQSISEKTPTTITTGESFGVYGLAYDGAIAYGVYGAASSATTNWAGYFFGNVNVTGTLSKGGGAFRIDHPLDPENKYLQHSFVESPDMKNIYDGNVVTDDKGYATVVMPDYFDALNRDFRYQLTVIGDFAQAIIGEKINNRKFVIRTDKPNIEVSWQVTGIRQDVWANANRIEVELDKPESEIGTYIHSKAYGMPVERDANYENMKDEIERRKSEDLRQ